MVESLSKIFAFFILIIFIVFVPLYQFLEKQDALVYQQIRKEVTTFADNARNKGYITPEMYNDLQQSLSIGHELYDVKMVHAENVYIPVYTDPADPSTYQNKWEMHQNEYVNDQIFETLFPNSNIPIDDPKRVYYMKIGDSFDIEVNRLTISMADRLRSIFFQDVNSSSKWYGISYGGLVLNENY